MHSNTYKLFLNFKTALYSSAVVVKGFNGSRKGTADLGVKMEKNPGVIKGRFYVTTSLSDSWEAFTPLHAGVTLGRSLH